MSEVTMEEATRPGPLSPRALKWLFFSPTRYFQSVPFGLGIAWLPAALLSGLASAKYRIDRRMLTADLKGDESGERVVEIFAASWQSYWVWMLFLGILWALSNWWIGGWWYRVRLKWSGAPMADPRQARLVYTFAGLVVSIPTLLYAVTLTFIYPDYGAAWEAVPTPIRLIVIGFAIWSCYVSWRGALAVFPVRPTPALWWFAILPISLYVGALGIILVLSKMYGLG